jgi:hypothetical protein
MLFEILRKRELLLTSIALCYFEQQIDVPALSVRSLKPGHGAKIDNV